MYKGKKVILTICARGGSKGLPGKNIKLLEGKPLIEHSIDQAKSLGWVDRIVISTDDLEIKKATENCDIEVPFMRPDQLSTDTAPKIPVFIHAIQEAEKYWKEKYDIWIDLDATSPLRLPSDIQESVKLLFEPDTLSVITAAESHHNPYFNMVETDAAGYTTLSKKLKDGVTRRQDAPKVYAMNGSVYVMWKDELLKRGTFFTDKTRVYVMPAERSQDIDNPIDFVMVEMLMRAANQKKSD